MLPQALASIPRSKAALRGLFAYGGEPMVEVRHVSSIELVGLSDPASRSAASGNDSVTGSIVPCAVEGPHSINQAADRASPPAETTSFPLCEGSPRVEIRNFHKGPVASSGCAAADHSHHRPAESSPNHPYTPYSDLAWNSFVLSN
jgi:hypothetical protein